MRYGRLLLFFVVGLCATFPAFVAAAANPALDALAQGSVVQFSWKEAVSEPFTFDVTINTSDKALNFAQVVGQPLTIGVAPGRTVSGMVESIEQVDHATAQGQYRLHLTPALNRLKFRSTSRTFYNLNTIQVVTAVLKEAGVQNVELRMAANPPVNEMTVQYQETDFSFVSRLLEEAGIHYHFEPSPTGEKVVLSDGNTGFPVLPAGKLVFATATNPAVVSFTRGQSLHSGQVQAGDYNWKTPTLDLTASAQAQIFGDLTERLFPAGIDTKVEAQAQANVRLASRLAEAQSCRGESTYPQLQAGHRVVLVGHPRADFNQEYVVTVVEHQRAGKEYRNAFRCLPAQIAYRPSSITPQPMISGVVSGIVVGPQGETKHVDQFGRVRVRFPWRSPGHSNQIELGDGGFVRVAQIATGVGSTAMWLPDVGDEVAIAFEHGDPRRPVVIGSLYNGKDVPPVALPENKHLSILRSQSAGGVKSELVYDGTPGNERLLIQSSQNVLTLAAGGVTLHGPSVAISATGDLVQRAGRALVVEAGADLSMKSGQNLSVTSQKDALVSVAGNIQLNSGGALQATVGSNAVLTVGGSLVMDSGKDLLLRTGQNFLLQSARAARLTAGEDTTIQTGKSLVANAGAMFQFVAAQTGTIQAGRGLAIRSDGNLDILGQDIAVKASGNLVTKGSKITQN
jgi:type VI secretion system secreted protein VgrG